MSAPLHVAVAEALGWTGANISGTDWWADRPGVFAPGHAYFPIPHYDTDWSAAGPLIEKFDLAVEPTYPGLRDEEPPWSAWSEVAGYETWARGSTPLIAVCNLILLLAAEGKLPKEHR